MKLEDLYDDGTVPTIGDSVVMKESITDEELGAMFLTRTGFLPLRSRFLVDKIEKPAPEHIKFKPPFDQGLILELKSGLLVHISCLEKL